ncbi:hypothetical protein ICW77_000964 [Listeria monocytogenes]|nr:hypothetical protein [Listeria monocytogenes]
MELEDFKRICDDKCRAETIKKEMLAVIEQMTILNVEIDNKQRQLKFLERYLDYLDIPSDEVNLHSDSNL